MPFSITSSLDLMFLNSFAFINFLAKVVCNNGTLYRSFTPWVSDALISRDTFVL